MKKFKNYWPSSRPEDIYSEGNFRAWSNEKRCAFIENQIDVLTRNDSEMAKRLEVSEETLDQMREDAATLRRLAEAEEAVRKTIAASAHKAINDTSDQFFNAVPKKGIYLPPNDILGKKGN